MRLALWVEGYEGGWPAAIWAVRWVRWVERVT